MTTISELAHLARALTAPRIRRVAAPLAERARAEGWPYERYLAAVLEEEVLARETSGGQLRVKAARLPAVKTLDDFDFSFQRSARKQVILHLAQLDFLLEAHNVVFLGPPGTGKTHLSIALAVQAARRGHRVAFATAHQWVQRLDSAQRAGRLDAELERLRRSPLLVCDEVGYVPFAPEAAALFFALSGLSLRARQPDRQLQQAVQRLGRDLRRRRGGRRHGRPVGPPRRDHLAQGRLLPAQGPPKGSGRRRLTVQFSAVENRPVFGRR
jgi:DNA replication protein DnaC